jgi:hypothetical protein
LRYNKWGKVVVVAGIHWDAITSGEVEAVEVLTEKLSDRILKKLKGKDQN